MMHIDGEILTNFRSNYDKIKYLNNAKFRTLD